MSAIRSAARRILRFVVRCSPAANRNWGLAMLRELDVVENDWAALGWALGSSAALCRQSLILQLRALRSHARSIVPVLSGIAAAGLVLATSGMTLTSLERASWFEPSRFAQSLFFVGIPDALCLVGVLVLWRTRRRIASGVFAAGATLAAHSIMYFVT